LPHEVIAAIANRKEVVVLGVPTQGCHLEEEEEEEEEEEGEVSK